MTDVAKFTVRRILVPLGAPGQTAGALEMAARLAAGFHAELVGVYLREPEFLQAAALPVSRFSYSERAERQTLDVAHMERALRVRAAQLRAALEATARRMNLRWSFQDMTGSIDEMIDKTVHDFDLVTLGQLRPAAGRQQTVSSFFVTRRILQTAAPVAVLLGSRNSSLETAAALARLFGRDLNIILPPSSAQDAEKRLDEIKTWLAAHGQAAQVMLPREDNYLGIFKSLEEMTPQILVMGRNDRLRHDPDFQNLMARLGCPLFLVAD